MSARTHYFFHTIGEAFPRGNPLSAVMWSLMAIRADLDFETSLIGRDDDRFARLLGRPSAFEAPSPEEFLARVYFFRGTLRSLYSAHRQLRRLTEVSPEFRQLAEGAGAWEEFVNLRRLVGRSSRQFDRARNSFGAHAEADLESSLQAAPPDRLVALSLTDRGRLGVAFGAEAYLAALVRESGAEDGSETLIQSLRDVTIRAARCIDQAIAIYATRYPVLRRD